MNAKKKVFPCSFKGCNLILGTYTTYKRHILFHTNIRPYRCNICQKSFVRSDYLKRHMTTHSDERPFQCKFKDCGKSFKKKSALHDHHLQVHSTEEHRYKCNVCGKTFALSKNYKPHLKMHFNGVNKPHKCLVCGMAFTRPNLLRKHILNHPKQGPVACTFEGCIKRFMCVSHLNSHLRVHEKLNIKTEVKQDNQDSKFHRCNTCEEFFKDSDYLQHILTHKYNTTTITSNISKKEWSSEECEKDNDNDNKILIDQSDDKKSQKHNYECELCDYLCKTKDDFIIHQRFHAVQNLCKEMEIINKKTSKITYKCKICLKNFHKESILVQHLFSRHFTEQLHDCNVCSRVFIEEEQLSIHLKEHFDADILDVKDVGITETQLSNENPIIINIKNEASDNVNQNFNLTNLKKQLTKKLVVSIKRNKNIDKMAIKYENFFKSKLKNKVEKELKSPVKKEINDINFVVRNQIPTIGPCDNPIEKQKKRVCKKLSVKLERLNVMSLNDSKACTISTGSNVNGLESDKVLEEEIREKNIAEKFLENHGISISSETCEKEINLDQNVVEEIEILNKEDEKEVENLNENILNTSSHEEVVEAGFKDHEIVSEEIQKEKENSFINTEDYVEVLVIENENVDGTEKESTPSNANIQCNDGSGPVLNVNQNISEENQSDENDVEILAIRKKLRESLFETLIHNATMYHPSEAIENSSDINIDKNPPSDKDNMETPIENQISSDEPNSLCQTSAVSKISNKNMRGDLGIFTSQKFSEKFQELNVVDILANQKLVEINDVNCCENRNLTTEELQLQTNSNDKESIPSSSVMPSTFNEFSHNLHTLADSVNQHSSKDKTDTISNEIEIPIIDLVNDNNSDDSSSIEIVDFQPKQNKSEFKYNSSLSHFDYKKEDRENLLLHLKNSLHDLLRKLEEFNIPISFEDIIFLSTSDYIREVAKYDFSEEQIKLIRAIRTRSRKPLNKKRKELEKENRILLGHQQETMQQLGSYLIQSNLPPNLQLPHSTSSPSFDLMLNNTHPVTISFQHPHDGCEIRKEIPIDLSVPRTDKGNHYSNINLIQSITNFSLQQNYEQMNHHHMNNLAAAATTAWDVNKENFKDIERLAVFNTILD